MEKIEKRGKAKLDLERLRELYEILAEQKASIRMVQGEVTRAILVKLDAIDRDLLEMLRELEIENLLELDEIYAEYDRVVVRYEIKDEEVEFM